MSAPAKEPGSMQSVDMDDAAAVKGTCDERYARVRDAFEDGLRQGHDRGGSVAVIVDGETVVDLWGGWDDEAHTRPWQRDTIVNCWSTTKGVVALCAAMLVDRGELDYDEKVATYWPEFAAAGKGDVRVHHLLTHSAGLPGIRQPQLPVEAFWDWDRMTTLLAAEEPWWEPGTMHGYHAFTYGFLVGEVVRRVTGRTIGQFVREELAGPLHADFWIGVPAGELGRISDLTNPPFVPENPLNAALQDPTSLTSRVLANPPMAPDYARCNDTGWRLAEVPAANGHGNAKGVAQIYSVLANDGIVDGRRYLSAEAIDRATTLQREGVDAFTTVPHSWAMGFLLNLTSWIRPTSAAFGHPGAGGSIGVADRARRMAFGYAMNRMLDEVPDPRWPRLVAAAIDSVDGG
jgi:CubicO group peptidase (beta-lactamase class C family)